MWSKQSTGAETPAPSTQQTTSRTNLPAPGTTTTETRPSGFDGFSTPAALRPTGSSPGGPGKLGASFQIKGQIAGNEDLQIDGTMEGPISLNGHELIVGPTAQLHSEIHAGEVIVYGKVVGNVHSKGRVDIKKDGSVTGDIDSARISIEDGAYFKGYIEIDPTKARKPE